MAELNFQNNASKRIQALQTVVDRSLRHVYAAVKQINYGYDMLWGLPDAELEEVLNTLGPQKVQKMFDKNSLHGSGLNSILDDMNYGDSRVITVRGRELELVSGQIRVVVPTGSGEAP